MVSDLLLQGKPVRPVYIKTRSTSAVIKKTTINKGGARSSSVVPVERKENIALPSSDINQPSCSYTPTRPRSIRSGKTLRPKMKRDTLRFKNSPSKSINYIIHNMQNTNCLVRQRLKTDTTNKDVPKSGSNDVQIREICFVKDGDGKKVIAKYKTSENEPCDDNLIVSWDSTNNQPTVFTQKESVQAFVPIKNSSQAGSSKQGAFRVHNFSRNNNTFNKSKRNKRSLRLLTTSADQAPKTDKKRKRVKSKIG